MPAGAADRTFIHGAQAAGGRERTFMEWRDPTPGFGATEADGTGIPRSFAGSVGRLQHEEFGGMSPTIEPLSPRRSGACSRAHQSKKKRCHTRTGRRAFARSSLPTVDVRGNYGH